MGPRQRQGRGRSKTHALPMILLSFLGFLLIAGVAFGIGMIGNVNRWLSDLPGFEEASRERISPLALAIRHGLLFMVMIFIAEYVTGIWLTGAGICPWDYSRWPDNVDGVIRLNFAPLWFFTGLLFERITKSKSRS